MVGGDFCAIPATKAAKKDNSCLEHEPYTVAWRLHIDEKTPTSVGLL